MKRGEAEGGGRWGAARPGQAALNPPIHCVCLKFSTDQRCRPLHTFSAMCGASRMASSSASTTCKQQWQRGQAGERACAQWHQQALGSSSNKRSAMADKAFSPAAHVSAANSSRPALHAPAAGSGGPAAVPPSPRRARTRKCGLQGRAVMVAQMSVHVPLGGPSTVCAPAMPGPKPWAISSSMHMQQRDQQSGDPAVPAHLSSKRWCP